MKFYRKHKEVFDFLTFIIVVVGTLATFIFRACDKRSSKPSFEIAYNFEYLESLPGSWEHDILQNTQLGYIIDDHNAKQDESAKIILSVSYLMSVTITDKSTAYSTIKKIEVDNLSIENPDYNFKIRKLPILKVSNDFKSLNRATVVNFEEGKTQSVHLVVSIPFIALEVKNIGGKGQEGKVFENSSITFDLNFYDQNHKAHKIKNISIKDSDLIKFNILSKSVVG